MRKIFGKGKNQRLTFDLLLIFGCLILALSVFLIVRISREEGAYVKVSVDGEDVGEYSLSADGEYSINGGTNILVISEGKAYMEYADCPDKRCVKQGKISYTGERIICLPNRVMAEIVGSDEEILGGG